MAIVYYPYPTSNFNLKVYQQGPYPPWMAQPAYSSRGLSEIRQWMAQPAGSDGGLSEFGVSQLNYRQPKSIQTAPIISPTYYPAPMLGPYLPTMIQTAMGYGQLSTSHQPMMDPMSMMSIGQPMIMSPSFYTAASPMNYSQPQWFQPASMIRYY
jgi:hypothetical protein